METEFIKPEIKQHNSENLINICDHAVTCTGRIALEFATVGKKSIMVMFCFIPREAVSSLKPAF